MLRQGPYIYREQRKAHSVAKRNEDLQRKARCEAGAQIKMKNNRKTYPITLSPHLFVHSKCKPYI